MNMSEPEKPGDLPLEKEPTARPPLAVFASMAVVVVFTLAFLYSARETLSFTAQKTPLVTRVFYLVTYGTFYVWPVATAIFMYRGRHWAYLSSQFILILLMLSLGLFTFMFWVQSSGSRHLSALSAVGFFAVLGVFSWNASSPRVKDHYRG